MWNTIWNTIKNIWVTILDEPIILVFIFIVIILMFGARDAIKQKKMEKKPLLTIQIYENDSLVISRDKLSKSCYYDSLAIYEKMK